MTAYDVLKSYALRHFPERWLDALRAWHHLRGLRMFDEADEPDMRVVRALVPSGTTAVDLGANVGIYTKLLSELVGSSGRVLSVEPVPATFAILSNNVRKLRLANVTPINAAVSDAEGVATMAVPQYPGGGRNFYEAQIVARSESGVETPHEAHQVRVRTTTLDAIVGGATPVSFVKCDVEGHEAACLAGAGAILRDQRPAWLIEISKNPDAAGTAGAALFERFAEFGYEPWLLDGQRVRRRVRGDRSTNYFFLTAEHVARIRQEAPDLATY